MYEYDKRVVLTLDAGGTKFLYFLPFKGIMK